METHSNAGPHLHAYYGDRKAFLNQVALHEDGTADFFIPARDGHALPTEAQVGTPLSVTIRVADSEASFHVNGRVKKRIVAGRPAGLWVTFHEEERPRQDLVLAFAHGQSVPYFRRRHTRHACDLPARVSHQGRRRRKTRALDLGLGGVRLALTGAETELNQMVEVELRVGRERLNLAGRVVSVIQKGPQQGMGVEFLYENVRNKKAVEEVLTRLPKSQAS
jgi:hypothetical protein